jgi:hypothetical protein
MNRAVYRLEPAGLMDRTDARVTRHAGAEVHKVQPAGCPRNGTMGMVYVQTVEGEFIGLVSKASLVKTGKVAPVRDRAAEAREERSRAIRERTRNLTRTSEEDSPAAMRRLKGRL